MRRLRPPYNPAARLRRARCPHVRIPEARSRCAATARVRRRSRLPRPTGGACSSGIFLGYAAYYLVRNNLALAIPDILREYPQYSKAQLGTALTGLSIAYGVSKFLMGSVSDRSNPKYFLPLGLLLSCGIMFASGSSRRSTARWRCSSCCRRSTAGCRAWGGRRAARPWCTGSAPRERGLVVSTLERGAQRRRRARRQLRPARRDAVRRLGREVLLQRADRGGRRRRRRSS